MYQIQYLTMNFLMADMLQIIANSDTAYSSTEISDNYAWCNRHHHHRKGSNGSSLALYMKLAFVIVLKGK